MAAVAGPEQLDAAPADLEGYEICPVRDDIVPFIVAKRGARCSGLLWRDLTADQAHRLDVYEGAFGYRLADVTLRMDGKTVHAKCYMPPEGIRAGDGSWSFESWQETHEAPAILAANELFAHRPLPDDGALRRMWPMIEARAWARHRAKAGPATIRHAATPQDVRIVASRSPQGSFFRLQGVDLTHRLFDGKQSHLLVREAFLGVDAAIVLPYDPVRDWVLLVEQFRMGPMMRHDPNPWMLEPVAGIVDARETPEESAYREALEEAGLTLRHLVPVSAYYASPGSSTDYMYSYVGICDIAQTAAFAGGLVDDGEDLRLHPMSLDDALRLADTGEVATGPLVLLLNWLARYRERLRA